MKKILKIKRQNNAYDAYYGENLEALNNNNSLLPDGYEYEMDQETPLYLLWLTIFDFGVIPRDLVMKNTINTHGDLVIGKKIGDIVKICKFSQRDKCFEVSSENLKKIWLEYNQLELQNADEIILERDGDQFSIRGVWFDKEKE